MPKVLSNIDLNNGSRAVNALDSVDAQDYVTQTELPVTNTDVIIYNKEYTSEDNGSTTGRLSWGNGSSDVNSGALVTENGTITEISISTGAVAVSQNINIEVNGVVVGSVTHNGNTGSYPVSINVLKNDFMNLNRTSATGGGVIVGTITVSTEVNVELFRGPTGLQGPSGNDGLDGNSTITGGSLPPVNPAPMQAAYFQTNGDVYISEATNTWNFLFNIIPQPSLTTKFTNLAVANVNTNSTFSGIDTTPLFDEIGGNISTTSSTITFLSPGVYEIYFNLYQESSAQRSNVGINFVYNGVPTGRISASSYIRNTSGHNESSTNLRETFQIAVNDTIEIQTLSLAGAGTVNAPVGTSVLEVRKIS